MLEYNKSLNILISEMITFFIAHIVYAFFFCPREALLKVSFWVFFFIVVVLITRVNIKNRKKLITFYAFIPFLATHLIGANTRTLAFGFLIYLITDIMFCILLEPRINIMYIIVTNLSFLYSLLAEYKMVTERIPIEYFWMVILCTNAGMITCAFISVSYRKRLEENKKQNEQLIKAQKSKDEFLANMSHEIRTPMNSVCGMTELMLRDEQLSAESRDYAKNIQSAGRSLLGIINDILDFSKIESGKMKLIEEPYSFCSMLNDIIVLAMARKGNKKLEIIVDCDPDIPSELIGDELKTKQVIVNLMTNAIKFTNSGAVLLAIRKRKTPLGINLTVSIKDTGIGIKKENIDKLFQSFQQVDTRKNRNVEGTGLGLAICRKNIDMMNGFMHVESEYGKGSEFRFTIPQGIYKETPCIQVASSENMRAITYVNIEHFEEDMVKGWYKELFEHLIRGLKVQTTEYKSLEEFQRRAEREEPEGIVIFTGFSEYQKNRKYFDKLGENYNVVVVMDKEAGELSDKVKALYKPFYALSIANAINHKKNHLVIQNDLEKEIFTAPSAKILIVDDNPMNLKVTTGLLKPYQAKVMLAQSGKEALEIVKNNRFDLIFMDHMMPGMDGIETASYIRTQAGWCKNVPIIALTANAIEGVREMFLSKGLQDFVAKPIEISQLERTLKKWLPSSSIIKNESVIGKVIIEEHQRNNLRFDKIDTKAAMPYFNNIEENYLDALKTYLELGKENIEQLQAYYEKEEWEDYTIKVHALKSTSLTIGAKELSKKAEELEAACMQKDQIFIEKHHQKMLEEYREISEDIQRNLPKDTWKNTEEKKELSTQELMTAINKLQEEIEQFDIEAALQVTEKLQGFYYQDEAVATLLKEVITALGMFEFEQALRQMEIVKERIFV